MYKCGIQGLPLRRLEDYSYNRKWYVTYNSHKSNYEWIICRVLQGFILGPLFFLMYINYLSSASEACLSILFPDDTNMILTGRNVNDMCNQSNDDLFRIQEWLHCKKKLFLDVLQTHYMIFTSRNKLVNVIGIIIDNAKISRISATNFWVSKSILSQAGKCISITFVKNILQEYGQL